MYFPLLIHLMEHDSFSDSEEFTDFKLSTLDGDICAHKAILAGSSPYFQTLFAKHNAQQYKNERHSIQVPYGKSAVKAVRAPAP